MLLFLSPGTSPCLCASTLWVARLTVNIPLPFGVCGSACSTSESSLDLSEALPQLGVYNMRLRSLWPPHESNSLLPCDIFQFPNDTNVNATHADWDKYVLGSELAFKDLWFEIFSAYLKSKMMLFISAPSLKPLTKVHGSVKRNRNCLFKETPSWIRIM